MTGGVTDGTRPFAAAHALRAEVARLRPIVRVAAVAAFLASLAAQALLVYVLVTIAIH
jgi:hypothetical protein